MLPLVLQSPREVAFGVACRAKERRLALGLTQKGLSERAGMSLSSLRLFERTGQIAFGSLVRIAFALDAVEGFAGLFPEQPTSLDEIVTPSRRQRGFRT